MPSRIDEAGHTKAFDYPVAEVFEMFSTLNFRELFHIAEIAKFNSR